jgi:sugar diacid utilization regulator
MSHQAAPAPSASSRWRDLGWLGGRTRISEAELDALVASQGSVDASVAFGEPPEGTAGFAVGHHKALEARAVAVATNQRAVRFADFRLRIAVLRDDDLAKEFVDRELGELARPDERMRERRETLRAYLEHGQSISSTAALRRRDRKTIERQLRSAEQLSRHRVSDRSDEVLIALWVTEILRRDHQPAGL